MNKLGLTWLGKENIVKPEPRLLIENKNLSNYVQKDLGCENLLIHGDNLLALKALEQEYTAKIKCIYIDPPYNTGSAFEHYDDNIEHSIWLNLMKARLTVLRNLLSEDGSIWISIDDDECHYLKVLCDEIFGRNNFVSSIIWQKKGSRSNDAKWFSDNHDYILVYAKNKNLFKINKLPRNKEEKGYSNPDNDPRGVWTSTIMSAKSGSASLLYPIVIPTGRTVYPPEGRFWACSKETFEKWRNDNRIWFGKDGNGTPRKKTFLSEVQNGLVPLTIWLREEVGDNQDAKHEIKSLNLCANPFDTPKPEKLLERILTIATNEGDFVLDSFLGSGTTIAVAQKMNRRWIGIEMEDTAYIYCKNRIDLIIGNKMNVGIDNASDGHGYKFYELAPTLLKEDSFGQLIINDKYDAGMLYAAVAIHEGFRFDPDEKCFWKQGKSENNSYLFVTTQHVGEELINQIKSELKDDEFLLISCKSFDAGINNSKNITLKKIPQSLLDDCEYNKDNYNLNIVCPPEYEEDEEDE